METGEMTPPVEKARQVFDVRLRLPVALHMLKGSREKYNTRLAELNRDQSGLAGDRREDFLDSDLARLVTDCVDRIHAAEQNKADIVVLSLTNDDANTIRNNSRPTMDPADVRLNQAMGEEFNGVFLEARRKAAKGLLGKARVILGF